MRVLTRYIMFILERIRSVSVRIFRYAKQNYAYVLHHRRLKVRCKRVSIRQLIWIFFRHGKKSTFRSLFSCLNDFVGWLSVLLLRRVEHTRACSLLCSIHLKCSNGYGLSYKSVWFLFCIPISSQFLF